MHAARIEKHPIQALGYGNGEFFERGANYFFDSDQKQTDRDREHQNILSSRLTALVGPKTRG